MTGTHAASGDDAQASGEHDALAIEAAFGGRWRAWLSDTGRWWAARADPLTAADLTAGCLPFLNAASPGELARLIEAQEELHPPAAPPPGRRRTRTRPAGSPPPGPGDRPHA